MCADGTKAPLADAAHHQQMLDTTKAPVSFAVLYDSCGESLADARQSFQFIDGRRIEIDESIARPLRSDVRGGRRILTGDARAAAWQPDAGRDARREQRGYKNRRKKAPEPRRQLSCHNAKPLFVKSLKKMPPKCAKC